MYPLESTVVILIESDQSIIEGLDLSILLIFVDTIEEPFFAVGVNVILGLDLYFINLFLL